MLVVRPRLSSRFAAALTAATSAVAVSGCAFPDHTFDDEAFFGQGGVGAPDAGGGAGISAGGGGAGSSVGGSQTGGGANGGGANGGGPSAGGSNAGGTGMGGTNAGGALPTGGSGGSPFPPDGGPPPDGPVTGTGGAPVQPDGGSGGAEVGPCGGRTCALGETCVANTCVAIPENCGNSADDDADTLVDCEDPDCNAGYVCALAPPGWTGPVALWTGDAGTAPACSTSGGFPTSFLSANAGLVVPPYSCPSCDCAPSPGTYCEDLEFFYDMTDDCTGAAAWRYTVAADGTCSSARRSGANPSAHSSELTRAPSSFIHGSCLPNQAPADFPEATWTTDVRACGAPASVGSGCGPGQCLPRPQAPFDATLCVFRSGDASCPSDYPVRRPGPGQEYYQTIREARSCSVCVCGPAACGGTVTSYTDENCQDNATVVLISGSDTCSVVPLDPTQAPTAIDTRSLEWTNPGPVCGTTTSVLQGAPAAESPYTVCCQTP